MYDKVGSSKWLQPAFGIYYWIKRESSGKIVLKERLGLKRNFVMPDYNGALYQSVLGPIMYRMDATCPMKSSWTTPDRYFYHVITNNGNDSVVASLDKKWSLNTLEFSDGDYWVFVKLTDAAGNSTIDSQKVTFSNGVTDMNVVTNSSIKNFDVKIGKSINSSVLELELFLPMPSSSVIKVFSINGSLLISYKTGYLEAGHHKVNLLDKLQVNGCISKGVYLVFTEFENRQSVVRNFILK